MRERRTPAYLFLSNLMYRPFRVIERRGRLYDGRLCMQVRRDSQAEKGWNKGLKLCIDHTCIVKNAMSAFKIHLSTTLRDYKDHRPPVSILRKADSALREPYCEGLTSERRAQDRRLRRYVKAKNESLEWKELIGTILDEIDHSPMTFVLRNMQGLDSFALARSNVQMASVVRIDTHVYMHSPVPQAVHWGARTGVNAPTVRTFKETTHRMLTLPTSAAFLPK